MSPPNHRRRGLLAGAAGLLAGLAGCRSVSRFEFRADPVAWPAPDREAEGYRRRLRTTVVTSHTATVEGVDTRATVRSRLAVYEHGGGDLRAPRPVVGVLSTPRASMDGRTLNPLARLPLDALPRSERGSGFLKRVGLDRVGHLRTEPAWARPPWVVATRPVDCLGQPGRIESHAGVLAGEPRSVAYLHLLRVEGDSVVLAAAIHGRDATDRQPLLGPDGSLGRAAFEGAVELFADACGALRYEA